ncbi:MAG TPA: GTPase HflX [Solirubrobacteraceae bacterium]|nr:GTPase HflX [Solirubrobacteraceae bacterium]
MHRSRNGRTGTTSKPSPGATNGSQSGRRALQRAFCVAALPEGDDLSELGELLRTAGVAVVGEMVQRREQPHPNTYLGPGKVVEAKAAAEACDANLIACDDELTPRQERNLEEALGMPVVDRTTVILDIFAAHAGSAEGKLQVELAQLEYNLARMRGLWTHLERLGGGIGTRGPGESQIETDRRLARDRISALRRRLEHVKGTRAVMRAERERAALPTVALVGYTNAGKSTLLNALTGAEVGVGDRLFHTLDPTTRTVRPLAGAATERASNGDGPSQAGHSGRKYLLSDTVGFISKLPHQLVDAFGATLEETRRADVLAHVLDASALEAQAASMQHAVEGTLEEIGAGERPRVLVLNKVDLLDPQARDELRLHYPGAVLVSGVTGEGLEELSARFEAELAHMLCPVELLVPYANGGSLAELHELAGDLSREDTPEGVRVRALVPKRTAERFARFAVAS